jgi:hypothetical protein
MNAAQKTIMDAEMTNATGETPLSDMAVFVCSSDSRRDVVDQTLPALKKFWPDCPWPIYIGLNTIARPLPLGTEILALPSQWQREFLTQLCQITQRYVLVALDDFLFEAPVNQLRVAGLFQEAMRLQLDYLRLVPLGRSLVSRLGANSTARLSADVERVPSRHPFYCAMQVAIWCKSHLEQLLADPVSIWDFERRYVPHSMHACIVGAPAIEYHHIVERGRWLPDATARFRRISLPILLGERPKWSRARLLRALAEKIQWHLWGYSNC